MNIFKKLALTIGIATISFSSGSLASSEKPLSVNDLIAFGNIATGSIDRFTAESDKWGNRYDSLPKFMREQIVAPLKEDYDSMLKQGRNVWGQMLGDTDNMWIGMMKNLYGTSGKILTDLDGTCNTMLANGEQSWNKMCKKMNNEGKDLVDYTKENILDHQNFTDFNQQFGIFNQKLDVFNKEMGNLCDTFNPKKIDELLEDGGNLDKRLRQVKDIEQSITNIANNAPAIVSAANQVTNNAFWKGAGLITLGTTSIASLITLWLYLNEEGIFA